MKFLQVAKRITLLILVNLLVMLTLGIIVSLLFHGRAAQYGYGGIFSSIALFLAWAARSYRLRFRGGWPKG